MEEEFTVIGFMPSLENVARIQRNQDQNEKKEKIKNLLERDEVFNFFSSVLLTSN